MTSLLHERFHSFVQSAFDRAPDVTIHGVAEPYAWNNDDFEDVTIRLRDLSLQLVNAFDDIYQKAAEKSGVEALHYEDLANDTLLEFGDWLTRSFNLEGDELLKAESFSHALSAELISEVLGEISEAKRLSDRGHEGTVLPFKKR